jgi:D-alanine-D-alanine ligase
VTPRSIVVLAGGISHERDVSLRSGRRVADGLLERGHTVILRDPDASLLSYLQSANPEIVWPVLHGASGEDGALLALLDALKIPYVGSDPGACRLAWDKPTAKVIVSRAGFATPESITLPRDTFRELGASQVLELVERRFGIDLVVKPAMGGSAQGVSIVSSADGLRRGVVEAYTYGEVALIERRIHGTEISVGIIDTGDGPVALPIVEIEPRLGIYSYDARYNAGETNFYAPARLSREATALAHETALAIHAALGLRHLSRIDLIIDELGVAYFLEANVLPGLTETSLMPQAILAAGLDLGEVYEALAQKAVADAAATATASPTVYLEA